MYNSLCKHDHAPVGRVTAEEHEAYCRLHGIIPTGPLFAKCEVRTGPHPQSYRPDLKLYSCLVRDHKEERSRQQQGKPAYPVIKAPAGFFKTTPLERASLITRPLRYANA